jgi:c-di-GMP-binding flagellar brake protein YcgR
MTFISIFLNMLRMIPLFASLYVSVVEGRYIFKDVVWKTADTTEIALFVAIVSTLLLSLLIVPKVMRGRDKKQQANFAASYFTEESKRLGLNTDDRGWATQLCASQKDSPLFEVLQSPVLFEKAVHAFLLDKAKEGTHVLATASEAVSRIRFKLGFRELSVEHPLVSTRNISPGVGGALFPLPSGRDPLIKRVRVMDGGELNFVISVNADDSAILKPGQSYRFIFTRKGDAAYSADVELHSIGADGLYRFYHTLNLFRQQSRRFARVDVRVVSEAKLKTRDGKVPDPEQPELTEPVSITFLDISAGGASFVCEKPFCRNDVLAVSFAIKGSRKIQLDARVLRTETLDGAAIGKTRHHIEFQDIDDNTRELLVKYVLDRQMHQRKMI